MGHKTQTQCTAASLSSRVKERDTGIFRVDQFALELVLGLIGWQERPLSAPVAHLLFTKSVVVNHLFFTENCPEGMS